MSYVVLARKYRPRDFSEVIGQEVVTRVLSGALEEGRLGHAYLFSGPRGTGKTTIARILAKCLNCDQGPTAKPCGTCERCRGADEGSEVDIIELDAASHTGVDTIRELREEVIYAPMRSRYKVYIVDEVHMLSKGAFNALLKTLEEPPPHVVFLFATTEQHKVLDTILSRCQVLRLRPLTEREIAERLTTVFAHEEVRPGEGVVAELAREANGGMRDALSLADKLLALAGNEPSLDDLARFGDDAGTKALAALLDAVEAGDRASVLGGLDRFHGGENALVTGLLGELRHGLLVAHCGADTPLLASGEAERRAAGERATRLGAERIELWMQELLRCRERMRLYPGLERILLEVTLLELCRGEATWTLGEMMARMEALEARLGGAPAAPSETGPAPGPAGGDRGTVRPQPAAPRSSPDPAPPSRPAPTPGPGPTKLLELWAPFLEELSASQGALAELLQRLGEPDVRGEGRVVIRVAHPSPAEAKLARGRRAEGACAKCFSKVAGRDVRVTLEIAGGPPKAEPKPAPKKERREDTLTGEVADLFGGVIEDLP